jgi:pyruvate dehydrogenase E2 component (dihydrolipoamide acetyltransferase)
MVYESDAEGTLTEIVAQEGDTLPIGEVIARVGEPGEASGDGGAKKAADEAEKDAGKDEAEAAQGADEASAGADDGGEAPGGNGGDPEKAGEPVSAPAATEAPATADGGGDGRVKASPIARRLAKDRGLDLSGISGSGPGGRIVKADVEKAGEVAPAPAEEADAAAAPAAAAAGPTAGAREKPETAKGEVEVVELSKLQQTVARRMAESKATAPHFYLTAEADMTRAWEARSRVKESSGEDQVVPSFNDLVVKACAIALREFPRANGAYRDGRVEMYARVNVGVAVAAQDALVVPTVFDADQKGLRQIATEARALASRVREGTITPPELSGGTFTVSNLGMYGVSQFSAVINPPQAAILAIGAIDEKPVVRDGEITVARVMAINLACDHRVLYGADGAEFLARVRALLEEPLGLAL